MKAEITLHGNRVYVRAPYGAALVDRLRRIPGAQAHWKEPAGALCKKQFDFWSYPAVKDCLHMLCDCLGLLPWMLAPEIRDIVGMNGVHAVEKIALDMGVLGGHVFKTEPYRHQRENLAKLLQHDRWLLADEQGTGKTHAVVNRLRNARPPLSNLLIVCPKSVVSTWKDQLSQHAEINGCIISDKGQPWWSPAITNYERVLADKEFFLGVPWVAVVFDEIHKIKSFTSKTARVCRKLSLQAKYVCGLSGTPAPNGLEDWLGVLSAIDPGLLPVSTKTAFEARYCVKERIGDTSVWKITGYRNVDELHSYIASITSRATKADCLDLPPKVYQTRRVSLQGEQARIYRELKKDAVARLKSLKSRDVADKVEIVNSHISANPNTNSGRMAEEVRLRHVPTLTIRNVLTEAMRLLQVVGGFVPDDDGRLHELPEKARLEALQDALEEAGDQQVVIWTHFRAEAQFLASWLRERHGPAVLMTGEDSTSDRIAALKQFVDGNARYFVATTATGGTGINGLERASTEVYYSRDFNLATWLQSQDRLHRIGQTRTVNVVKILASGTVDDKIDMALERKADLQELLLKDPEELF